MASADFPRLLRRARWGYEIARLRGAAYGVVPIIAIVMLAAWIAHRPVSTAIIGTAAVLLGAVLLWYGRNPQKAVLPGFAAGLIPLALALCANHFHVCGPSGCMSLCMYACVAGGFVAGLGVSIIGHRLGASSGFLVSASGVALLTGAMGCACIGYSGIAGLVLGFAIGFTSGRLRRRRQERM
jgi:hypothetical protein